MSDLLIWFVIGVLLFSLPVGFLMGRARPRQAPPSSNTQGQNSPAPGANANQPPAPTQAAPAPAPAPAQQPAPPPTQTTKTPPVTTTVSVGTILTTGFVLTLVGVAAYLIWTNQWRPWNYVSGTDTATLIFISIAVLLGTFFLADSKWKSLIRGFAIIALAGILFFSGFGESLRQALSHAERCAATNNCVTPDIRVYAGQPSGPIPNYSGTCIRVTEVNRSGNVSRYYAEYRWNGVWSVNNTNINDALRVIVVGSPSSFVEYKITRTNGTCT